MKATELRIGDYFEWFASEVVRITFIAESYVNAEDDRGVEQIQVRLTDLRPIQLTEEILEKNDCTITKSLGDVTTAVMSMDDKEDRILILSSEYNPATDEDEWITSIGFYDVPTGARFVHPHELAFLRKIRYVHELQHLLWALGVKKEVEV